MGELITLVMVLLFFIYYPTGTIGACIVIGIIWLISIPIGKYREEKRIEEKEEEEKIQIENWRTNLRNGKEVEFKECKIKITEEEIIINDIPNMLKNINKLVFRERLREVLKYNYYTSGGLMSIDTMTPNEYYRDLEFNRKHHYLNDRYSYTYLKEYFISIEFVERFSLKMETNYKDFSIGYSDITDKDKQLLLELNNFLIEIKEKSQKQ